MSKILITSIFSHRLYPMGHNAYSAKKHPIHSGSNQDPMDSKPKAPNIAPSTQAQFKIRWTAQ
jgi:hypothetical protein